MRRHKTGGLCFLIVIGWLLSACVSGGTAVPTAALLSPTLTPTRFVTATPAPVTPTVTSTPTPVATATTTPTSTPDVYQEYTINNLADRSYGGGELEIVEILAQNTWFTRYLIRYPSDSLVIYGFLNVPVFNGPIGRGPFPVIIALHGYIDPEIYNTIDYTTGYADSITRAGYIVFHPNLRDYPPSDKGDNLFRVGMAVDVMNLIALIKGQAADLEALSEMDSDRIGMWGHSMGGGVATRVLTISEDVQAAVLYASMSGDEKKNYEAINLWSDGLQGLDEIAVPEAELARISPAKYFDRITASVSIHHGRADQLVPLRWSVETCSQMAQLRLNVSCTFYKGMPHTFYGEDDASFINNVIVFFDEVLK